MVHLLGPRFSGVRGFLEGSGPVGWADADELPEMAAELRLLAAAQPNVHPALECAARRIEEAAIDGLSVIGCVELLGYESDGRRSYFVRDYDFDDQLLE